MSLTQFLVIAVVAVLVTIPVVMLLPRARASVNFDRLLWAATAVVGFLFAWVGVGMAKNADSLDSFVIGETPVLAVVIGALAGALALNLPLWLVDRFGAAVEEPVPDESEEQLLPAVTGEQEEVEEAAPIEN
jgi:uncharacterized membrane protein YedE/YeeE